MPPALTHDPLNKLLVPSAQAILGIRWNFQLPRIALAGPDCRCAGAAATILVLPSAEKFMNDSLATAWTYRPRRRGRVLCSQSSGVRNDPQILCVAGVQMKATLVSGLLMIAVGALMFLAARTQSDFFAYRLLEARARLLWRSRVHAFLQVSGLLVIIAGVLRTVTSYFPLSISF